MSRLQQIIAIAAEGKSATEIGKRLGVSRNVVIGCVHRAGLHLGSLNGYATRERIVPVRNRARATPERLAEVSAIRSELMRARHADPQFAAAHSARQSARMKAMWAAAKAGQP